MDCFNLNRSYFYI